jgi:hypothetical protein
MAYLTDLHARCGAAHMLRYGIFLTQAAANTISRTVPSLERQQQHEQEHRATAAAAAAAATAAAGEGTAAASTAEGASEEDYASATGSEEAAAADTDAAGAHAETLAGGPVVSAAAAEAAHEAVIIEVGLRYDLILSCWTLHMHIGRRASVCPYLCQLLFGRSVCLLNVSGH